MHLWVGLDYIDFIMFSINILVRWKKTVNHDSFLLYELHNIQLSTRIGQYNRREDHRLTSANYTERSNSSKITI